MIYCSVLFFSSMTLPTRRRRSLRLESNPPPAPAAASRLLHGVLEVDLLARQRLVHSAEGVQLVLGEVPVLRVQVHLEHAGAVGGKARALAHDLGREHDVSEQSLVHGGEGPAAGPREREAALRRAHDLSVSYDDDILAAKLLLELAHKPLLDLPEALAEAEGDLKDNSLPASLHVDFLGRDNIQVPQVALELGVGGLEVEESLRHGPLEGVGLHTLLLEDLLPGDLGGHVCVPRRRDQPAARVALASR